MNPVEEKLPEPGIKPATDGSQVLYGTKYS